ncbi:MAG TPA: site-2 protease family protein [Patescibacteria group bacterium]|nr:site-2 protease family protein [Patescibacteria group bacterium]
MVTSSLPLFKPLRTLKILGAEIRVDMYWIVLIFLMAWSLATQLFPKRLPTFEKSTFWMMGGAAVVGYIISLLLHEIAHISTARGLGTPMHRITLFLFGGLAEQEEEPEKAKDEILLALSGPVVSFALALFFWMLGNIAHDEHWPAPALQVIRFLATANLSLAAFNLIPAFPLDGGRIFRALVWVWRRNIAYATHISANVGSVFGILLMIFGFYKFINQSFVEGLWWFMAGLSLRIASRISYGHLLNRRVLEGETVKRFLNPNMMGVSPDMSIYELVHEHSYKHYYDFYAVLENDKTLGYISLESIQGIAPNKWHGRKVRDFMQDFREATVVSSDTPAQLALDIMKEADRSHMMVVDNGHFVGMVDLKNIMGYLELRAKIGDTTENLVEENPDVFDEEENNENIIQGAP